MAKIVSVINMKGGVGKTTIAVNLAYALFKFHNKNVLLVDIDPQFNATQYLISMKNYIKYVEDDKKFTMYDVLCEPVWETPSIVGKKKQKVEITELKKENTTINYEKNGEVVLDILPSHLNLVKLRTDYGIENRLNTFLNKIKSSYDHIIIDCPPTMSFFTMNAFIASDYYTIPLRPDYLSRMGLPLIASTMKQFELKFTKKVKPLGVIFNGVHKRYNMHNEVIANVLKDKDYSCFETLVPTNVHVAKLVSTNTLVFKEARTKNVADAIKLLAKEHLKKLGE